MALVVSVADFKLWMRNEIPTADDPYCLEALQAAQQTVFNACQRSFEVAGVATARSFYPTNTDVLFIHDCTSITSVVDFGTTLTTDVTYRAEPLGNISPAGETVPYYQLRRLNDTWWRRSIVGTIVVTAAWGWTATPAAIKSAIRIIAKDEFNQRSTAGFGLVTVTDAGGVGTRENRIVREAVLQYRHPLAIGIA